MQSAAKEVQVLDKNIFLTWQSFISNRCLKFGADQAKTVAPFISELLNKEIPVLLYAGDLDYICNYLGTKALALKLDWDYTHEFNFCWWYRLEPGWACQIFKWVYVPTNLWCRAYGTIPSDQPEVALNMIVQFLKGGAFYLCNTILWSDDLKVRVSWYNYFICRAIVS